MKIRIAQVKFYPEKGNLEANHGRLMEVLEEIREEEPDVVITSECFLDGFVVCTRSFGSEIIIAFTHPGQALITGPKRMIYRNDEEEKHRFAVTDVDLIDVDRMRKRSKSHLKNRRADLYELG